MSTTQHSLRLQNYTVPMWPLVVHIRACFVRSNLKYASGSKIPRTKSGVKSCEKKSDIILTLATCCDGIRGVRRNDGNYLTHIQHRYTGGVQLCHQMIFPSYTRFLSFLPSFVAYFLHVSLFFSVSPFPSFSRLFLRLFFPLSSLSPSLYSLVYEPCLIFYSIFLPTFVWLGFSLAWRRF